MREKKESARPRTGDDRGEGPVSGHEATAGPAAAPSREDIARRAYEISLTRGAGDPVADWLQAEEELRQR